MYGINKISIMAFSITMHMLCVSLTQGIVGHIAITKTMTAFTHLDVEILINSLFYVNL